MLERFAQTVVVRKRVESGTDKFNNKVWTYAQSTVSPVLVMPAEGQEVDTSVRPDGYMHKFTLFFEKTYADDLDNAQISVDGGTTWLDVLDAPAPVSVSPINYGRVVRIGVTNG